MTLPTTQVYVGKPREAVTAVYWNGAYQNGELLEIKNWIESVAPNLQINTFDTTIDEMVVPYVLYFNDPVTNVGGQVIAGGYVFLDSDGKVRVLDATIFEILFQQQV